MSSSDSDEMPLDYVTLLGDVISKVSDSSERRKLQASFDYRSDGTGDDEQLQLKFMKTLQKVFDAQVPQVSRPAKKSRAMKRRERLRNQVTRGGLSAITQHGVPRSTAQLMGKKGHTRFRAEKGRLLDQIRIVSAQQEVANSMGLQMAFSMGLSTQP